MATAADEGGTVLSPDDAFGLLGNESRMAILQTLASARKPVSSGRTAVKSKNAPPSWAMSPPPADGADR